MFGCHNCSQRPQKKENYDETECARCRAAMDPVLLSEFGENTAGFRKLNVMHPAYSEEYPDEMTFKEHFCREEMVAAVFQTAKIILRLKNRSHSAWRILEMKINRPELSYSQLADIFSCRKQNIQYHLRKILDDCPELGYVLRLERRKQRAGRRISG